MSIGGPHEVLPSHGHSVRAFCIERRGERRLALERPDGSLSIGHTFDWGGSGTFTLSINDFTGTGSITVEGATETLNAGELPASDTADPTFEFGCRSGPAQALAFISAFGDAEPPDEPPSCPDDVLLSNYQTSPADDQLVEVANVGGSNIDLDGCSLVTFNIFTEQSAGAATLQLSGTLDPGETARFAFGGELPLGPAAFALYDVAPAPPDGTPFSREHEITGLIYLDNETVYGVAQLIVPAHNDIYECIHGGSGPGPFSRPFDPISDVRSRTETTPSRSPSSLAPGQGRAACEVGAQRARGLPADDVA